MEKLLALEMVRVTEAAAIASARLMGRGDRDGRRSAAPPRPCAAAMDEIEMEGTIVIGEGERDEAPMLYIGEQVGMAGEARAGRSTSRSTRSRARTSSPPARPTRSRSSRLRRRGGLVHAPDTYLEKLCVGPDGGGQRRHHQAARRERRAVAEALGRRPRTSRSSSSTGRATRRSSPRSAHRRPDQAHHRRRPLRGDQLRGLGHGRPRGHGHRRRPGGRDHGGGDALPRRRDPGTVQVPQRRGAGPRRAYGPRRRERDLPHRGPGLGREPRVRRDRRDARRPPRGRALLRRRRADPLAGMAYQTKTSASSTPSTCSIGSARRAFGSRRLSAWPAAQTDPGDGRRPAGARLHRLAAPPVHARPHGPGAAADLHAGHGRRRERARSRELLRHVRATRRADATSTSSVGPSATSRASCSSRTSSTSAAAIPRTCSRSGGCTGSTRP